MTRSNRDQELPMPQPKDSNRVIALRTSGQVI